MSGGNRVFYIGLSLPEMRPTGWRRDTRFRRKTLNEITEEHTSEKPTAQVVKKRLGKDPPVWWGFYFMGWGALTRRRGMGNI
jgi:hypothetical protein